MLLRASKTAISLASSPPANCLANSIILAVCSLSLNRFLLIVSGKKDLQESSLKPDSTAQMMRGTGFR